MKDLSHSWHSAVLNLPQACLTVLLIRICIDFNRIFFCFQSLEWLMKFSLYTAWGRMSLGG